MSNKDILAGPVVAASAFYGKDGEPDYMLYIFERVEGGMAYAKGEVAEQIRKMSKGGCPIVIRGRYEMRPLPVKRGVFQESKVLVAEEVSLLEAQFA